MKKSISKIVAEKNVTMSSFGEEESKKIQHDIVDNFTVVVMLTIPSKKGSTRAVKYISSLFTKEEGEMLANFVNMALTRKLKGLKTND